MAAVADAPSPAARPQGGFLIGLTADWAFKVLCFLAACAPLALLGLIVAVLYGESLPGIGEVGGPS